MMTLRGLPDGGLEITPVLTPPCVYVDHAGIADLAKDQELGPRFRNALLHAGGTLYVSAAHLLEIFGLGLGPLNTSMRGYLDSFGPSFVITDSNPATVIRREKEFQPGMQNPAIDVSLIKLMVSNWDAALPLSAAALFDFIANNGNLPVDFRKMHRQHRDGLNRELARARHAYRTDPKVKKRIDTAQYDHVSGTPGTEYIAANLRRETIRSQEELKGSEGLDYQHSAVALAYCDHVVLDKQWAARVGRFRAPIPMAKIWKVGELANLAREIAGSGILW